MTEPNGADPGQAWVPRIADRLSIRFAIVLAVALLPLGVVSWMQTMSLQGEIQQRTEAALVGETLRSASREIGTIRNAQGVAAALAVSLTTLPPPAQCAALMQQAAGLVPEASLIAFLPKDGKMTCSSNGRTYDFAGNPLFDSVLARKAPNFIVNRNGPVSGTSVLGVSHPVFAADGAYQGYVTVSLPHKGLETLDQSNGHEVVNRDAAVVFWTFDGEGEVLTASDGLDNVAQQLPKSRPLAQFIDLTETVFQDRSFAGVQRTYAVVPIVPGQLYLMSSWDKRGAEAINGVLVWPYLPPITMWIVGLIVAAVSSERLVTRHVRSLSTQIRHFADGDRGLRQADLRTAPVELRDLGEAFQNMSLAIERSEADLEDSIHQKEVLLREVHHRVKNNLQLIASIMNLQMRKAIAPEAKVLLKGLQDRVMSLATIHRGLYQTSGLVDVHADELFRDIVRQIVNMGSGAGRKFAVKVEVEELRLTPDQAVPLSLLLTEAMTNAMKYAGAPNGKPVEITVRLWQDTDGMHVMEILNSLPTVAPHTTAEASPNRVTTSTGLGEQLLTAFSQQVNGVLSRDITAHSYRLSVRFQPKAIDAASEEPA